MANKRVFFQDFLFENMPVDEYDNPIANIEPFSGNANFPMETISFDKLLKSDKQEEWKEIYDTIAEKDVVIIDDVPLANTELAQFKEFYLKAYCSNLSRYARKCYVSQ